MEKVDRSREIGRAEWHHHYRPSMDGFFEFVLAIAHLSMYLLIIQSSVV